MNLIQLKSKVRQYTNDTNSAVFKEDTIRDFINEGIDRLRENEYFYNEVSLPSNDSELRVLPSQYHYLLAIYAASRCFDMDERHYQGATRMNEFEQKLEDLLSKIDSGELVMKFTDDQGIEHTIESGYSFDAVSNDYFNESTALDEDDF